MATNADVCLTVVDAEGQQALSDVDVGTVPAAALLNGPADEVIARAATPIDLAYIIYTSGSTGRPKGVMVEHHSIVNRLCWMIREYGFSAADRILQKTPYGFDVSVWEFFAPLISGGTVVVLRPQYHLDPHLTLDCIEGEAVTIIHFVPSMLSVFLETEGIAVRTRSLRLIVCSGEALPPATAVTALDRVEALLVNLYGPTEATVDVTAFTVPPTWTGSSVPIGKPIDNIATYVVDSLLRLTPVGIEGELLLGGIGVARGYVNADELTAERFAEDTYGRALGGRVYRTGDRAVWTSRGQLEFRGRLDNQLKIRGLRIEPEEVEHAIVASGLARHAAVAAHGKADSRYLVAYLVGATTIDEIEVRERLAERLPGFMIPGVVLDLSVLPLSANGKLLRDQLPEPTFDTDDQQDDSNSFTETERHVADIWCNITGVEVTRRDADFFSQGGNSMELIHVAAAIHETIGVPLTLATLIGRPRFCDLVAAVTQRLSDGSGQNDQSSPTPLNRRAPASATIRRIWAADAIQDATTYNVPLSVRLRGEVEFRRLRKALSNLLRRHRILGAQIRDTANGLEIHVTDCLKLPLEVHDLRNYSGAEQRNHLTAERANATVRRFQLEAGPLMAATLIRLSDDESELHLCFHHTAIDAGSLEIVCDDLARDYAAPGDPVPVEPDYLHYCRSIETIAPDSAQWWRNRLSGTDRFALPRLANGHSSQRFASRQLSVGRYLTEAAAQVAAKHEATLFTVCLAAWLLALSGEDGVQPVLAVQVSNRPPAYRATVGPFINQVPVVGPSADVVDEREFFHRAKSAWQDAVAHLDIPFDHIVRVCGATVSPDGTAFTDVGFSFTVAPCIRQNWGNLTVEKLENEGPAQPKAPIFIELVHCDGALGGAIEYRSDLHTGAQIAQLHGRWDNALRRLLLIG